MKEENGTSYHKIAFVFTAIDRQDRLRRLWNQFCGQDADYVFKIQRYMEEQASSIAFSLEQSGDLPRSLNTRKLMQQRARGYGLNVLILGAILGYREKSGRVVLSYEEMGQEEREKLLRIIQSVAEDDLPTVTVAGVKDLFKEVFSR